MTLSRHASRRQSPASLRTKRTVAWAVTGSLSAATMVLAAGSASADPNRPVSQSEARFLDGSLNGLASLDPAQAKNFGGPTVAERNPLSATVLNSIVVAPGPINLLGDNSLLDLGAVKQVAVARPTGSSVAASGAVTDDGAIDVGGSPGAPGNATLSLGSLLPGAGILSDLDVSIGALSARATQARGANGNQASSYQIADLKLTLDSTVVSGLLGPLGLEQDEISGVGGLQGVLGGLPLLAGLGVVNVANVPALSTIVGALGTQTSTQGDLVVDLESGEIIIDLEQIINLNNLPPNTPLLPYILSALNTQLVPTVQAALNRLTANITTALDGATATTTLPLAVPVAVPEGILDTAVGTVVSGLSLSPTAVATGTFDTAISGVLDGILELTANVQAEPPNTHKPSGSAAVDEFTVTALRVGLLGSGALDSGVVVDLASASVGSNFGPAVGTNATVPVATGIDPDRGPVAGGTLVTITGSNFTPGSKVSVDGGPAITPDSVGPAGHKLVYTAPAHPAGPVDVTVTTSGGTTAPLTYTYIPNGPSNTMNPPVITDPDDGDTTDDTTPPIVGTGNPGATVTVREGTTVICKAVVRANRVWTCTPGTPLSLGSHTIKATQSEGGRTSGASNSVTFRVVADDGVGDNNGDDTSTGGLPDTGGWDGLPFGVAGLALLLTGLGIAAAHRRHLRA